MKKQEFCEELSRVLQVKGEGLTPQSNLSRIKELDSLAMLDLIAFVDKQFDIQISAEDLANFQTVENLIDFVGAKKFD